MIGGRRAQLRTPTRMKYSLMSPAIRFASCRPRAFSLCLVGMAFGMSMTAGYAQAQDVSYDSTSPSPLTLSPDQLQDAGISSGQSFRLFGDNQDKIGRVKSNVLDTAFTVDQGMLDQGTSDEVNGLDAETRQGRLQNASSGCPEAGDATLILCDSADELWVKSLPGLRIGTFVGQKVELRGELRDCSDGNRYIDLNSVQPIRDCDPVSPPPAAPENIALHAPVVSSFSEAPNQMQNVTDGDLRSYWEVPGKDAWIYLDLGPGFDPDGDGRPAGISFNQARILWGKPYASQFGLYVWDAVDERWARFYHKGDNRQTDQDISFPRAYGRYPPHSIGSFV